MASVYKVVLDAQDKTAQAFAKLESNLKKAEKATDRVKKSMGGMKASIGLAAGAAGFGALAKSALESADTLAKTADRLGIAASELNTLQLAANFAGVETEGFNKLMEIFQKRVGEAAEGTGQAQDALKKFGIDAKELAKLPLDDQLKIIADEFKNIENPTERAAAASDLFSNRGIKLINVLKDGSDGLENVADEFERLGLAVDDKALDQIEDFNDSMTKVQAVINAAMVKGLSEAAPEMEKFAEKAAEMAVPLVGDLLDGLMWIMDNIDKVTTGIKLLLTAMVVKTITAFGAAVAALVVATGPIGLAIVAFGAVAAAVVIFMDEIKALLSPITDAGTAIAGFVQKINPFSKDVSDAEEATRGLADAEGVLEEATGSAAGELDFLRSAGLKYKNQTDKAETSTDEFADAIERVQNEANPATPAVEAFGDSAEVTADQEMTAAVRTNEFADAIERLKKESRTASDDVADLEAQIAEYDKAVAAGEASQKDLNTALRRGIEDIAGVEFATEKLLEQISAANDLLVIAKERFGENSKEVKALKDRLEELSSEYLEAQEKADGLTDAQRELLEEMQGFTPEVKKAHAEIANLNTLFEKGLITMDQFRERTDALAKSLEDTGDASSDAEAELRKIFETAASEGDASGALGGLIGTLIGSGGVKSAIDGCFSVGPVTAFGSAVSGLFTGAGSPLGQLKLTFENLESALGTFFTSGSLKFKDFVDVILKGLADMAAGAIATVGINFLKNIGFPFKDGGYVEMASGGRVRGPGGPKDDRIPAMLSNGEFVIQASSVKKFGSGFFDILNRGMMPQFNGGGLVDTLGSFFEGGGGFDPISIIINSVVSGILQNLIGQIFGGDNVGETSKRIRKTIDEFLDGTIESVMGKIDEIMGDVPYSSGEIQDITDKIKEIGIPKAGRGKKADGERHRKSLEAYQDDPTGLADSMLKAFFDAVNMVRFPDFNLDPEVFELFKSADATSNAGLKVVPRQHGGPLERGQASIVGEAGPEVFVPGRGGTVSPIAQDGAKKLIEAVNEVKNEVAALRRQMDRQAPQKVFGASA